MTGNASHGDDGSRRVGSKGTALPAPPPLGHAAGGRGEPPGGGCSRSLRSAVGCTDAHPGMLGMLRAGSRGAAPPAPRSAPSGPHAHLQPPTPAKQRHALHEEEKAKQGRGGTPQRSPGAVGRGVAAGQSRLHGQLREVQIVRPCD